MKLKNIDHMVITTKDLDKCLHFYSDILGMKHRVVDGQHVLEFGNEKFNIHEYVGEFLPYAKNAAAGSQDFCLVAEGDIYEIKRMVEDAGIDIIEGVVAQNGALGLMDSVYMYDPDGNLVEIAVYR